CGPQARPKKHNQANLESNPNQVISWPVWTPDLDEFNTRFRCESVAPMISGPWPEIIRKKKGET
ncbi:MAG: hypothetical protein ACKVIW_11570, partial [bacterium]